MISLYSVLKTELFTWKILFVLQNVRKQPRILSLHMLKLHLNSSGIYTCRGINVTADNEIAKTEMDVTVYGKLTTNMNDFGCFALNAPFACLWKYRLHEQLQRSSL